jgi:hypothetical protein
LIAEEKRMYARVLKSVSLVLALAFAASASLALSAQDSGKPAAKAYSDDSASRWDIFGGYSYFAPQDTVTVGQATTVPSTGTFDFKAESRGTTESVNYFFTKHIGVEFESGQDDGYKDTGSQNLGTSNSGIFTYEPGFIFRFPMGNVTPFVHALIGVADVGGPDHEPYTWGPGLTAGGGLDYQTPLFNHHLAIRLFQADYEYIHADSGTSHLNSSGAFIYGSDDNINGAKLSAGVVYHIGTIVPPPPVTLACSVNPTSVFPGDPVTVTAVAGDLDPKLSAIYSWSGAGATGTGTTVTIATGALAPGSYTVEAEVKEGKPGKEGLKPGQTADCSASFTVKAFEPPTVSCVADPGTINPGDKSTITATGVSPQNRLLTYSYSVVAGTITGNGTTATFDSTGAPTGAVAITCNVADDKGGTATNGTTVTITAPYVKPIPHASALCPITFDKDKKRPTRVDNEAKACLDQVSDALKNDSTASVVVVGESTATEKEPKKGKHAKVEDYAAERAVNTKDYLVNEEQSGIDASRISVRTGTADSKSVENYLVPAGATFDNDVTGTTPVDESAVKKLTRKPIPVPGSKPPVHHHKKATAAKSTQ